MVENSSRDSEIPSEKFTDSLQTESRVEWQCESAKTPCTDLEIVGNSNRDSEFSREKITDSLQTESSAGMALVKIVCRRWPCSRPLLTSSALRC